jgi:ferrous iron transport protein A
MKLSDLHENTHGTVKALGKDERFLSRITSIGLTEGATFQVIKNDKKMPVLVYVRETLLAINRRDCEKIEVEVRA